MTPASPSPPRRLRRFFECGPSCWRREFIHLVIIALKSFGALLLLAWLVGIPGAWLTPRLTSYTAPFDLKISRVTWNPLRGLVAHRVQILDPEHDVHPFFQARQITLRPDYRQLIRGTLEPLAVDIARSVLSIPLAETTRTASTSRVVFNNISAGLGWAPSEVEVTLSGQSGLGTSVDVQGRIARAGEKAGSATEASPRGLHTMASLFDRTARAPAWLASLYDRLAETSFSAPPVARISFFVNPANPLENQARLAWQSSDFAFRNARFAGASFVFSLDQQRVVIDEAIVEMNGQHVMAEGHYQLTNDLFNARIYGDLNPEQLEWLLPARWRDPLDRAGIQWNGTLHAEGWLGPCGIAEIPRHWSGWITLENGQLNDFPVQRAFASFKREPETLLVQDGLIEGGTGAGRGALRFTIKTDYTNRVTAGELDLGIEMQQFAAVLPRGLRRLAHMFEITTRPVHFLGAFNTPMDDLDQLVVTGNITGEDFFFRTVPVNRATVGLVYSNNLIRLDPFIAQCATGGISGALVLDLPRDRYQIDLEVTLNPQHVAPMVSTNFPRYFQPYHFTDDILLRVNGLVDVEDDALTDLHVHASGKRIGMGSITFDHLLLQAHRTPGRLAITNITGELAQGSVTGTMTILHQPAEDAFTIDLGVNNLALDALAAMRNPGGTNRAEGILRGQVHLAGTYPDAPGWTNLTGHGRTEVTDGRLLLVPIFGGLSSLLTKIYPGLGFSEQNAAEATFRVARGRIRTDDLKINGNLVSLSAKGHYTLDHQIKFDVLVHPFRDGTIASAVRLVTLPISMLLEFNVSGPATNPVWNAVNIPFL